MDVTASPELEEYHRRQRFARLVILNEVATMVDEEDKMRAASKKKHGGSKPGRKWQSVLTAAHDKEGRLFPTGKLNTSW